MYLETREKISNTSSLPICHTGAGPTVDCQNEVIFKTLDVLEGKFFFRDPNFSVVGREHTSKLESQVKTHRGGSRLHTRAMVRKGTGRD